MGAWSSVDDQARLATILIEGDPEVFSDELHAQMVARQADFEEGYTDAGYGHGGYVKHGGNIDGQHYPLTMASPTGAEHLSFILDDEGTAEHVHSRHHVGLRVEEGKGSSAASIPPAWDGPRWHPDTETRSATERPTCADGAPGPRRPSA